MQAMYARGVAPNTTTTSSYIQLLELVYVPVPLCKYCRLTSPLELCSATVMANGREDGSLLFPTTIVALGEERRVPVDALALSVLTCTR